MKHLLEALHLRDAGLATWTVSRPYPAREQARIWAIREKVMRYRSVASEDRWDDVRQTAEALVSLGDSSCLIASCDTVDSIIPYHYQVYGSIDEVWLSAIRTSPGLICVAVSFSNGTWTLRPRSEDYRRVCINLPLHVEARVFWPGVAEAGDIPPGVRALIHASDDAIQLRFEAETECAPGLHVVIDGKNTRNLPPTWPSFRHKS